MPLTTVVIMEQEMDPDDTEQVLSPIKLYSARDCQYVYILTLVQQLKGDQECKPIPGRSMCNYYWCHKTWVRGWASVVWRSGELNFDSDPLRLLLMVSDKIFD